MDGGRKVKGVDDASASKQGPATKLAMGPPGDFSLPKLSLRDVMANPSRREPRLPRPAAEGAQGEEEEEVVVVAQGERVDDTQPGPQDFLSSFGQRGALASAATVAGSASASGSVCHPAAAMAASEASTMLQLGPPVEPSSAGGVPVAEAGRSGSSSHHQAGINDGEVVWCPSCTMMYPNFRCLVCLAVVAEFAAGPGRLNPYRIRDQPPSAQALQLRSMVVAAYVDLCQEGRRAGQQRYESPRTSSSGGTRRGGAAGRKRQRETPLQLQPPQQQHRSQGTTEDAVVHTGNPTPVEAAGYVPQAQINRAPVAVLPQQQPAPSIPLVLAGSISAETMPDGSSPQELCQDRDHGVSPEAALLSLHGVPQSTQSRVLGLPP